MESTIILLALITVASILFTCYDKTKKSEEMEKIARVRRRREKRKEWEEAKHPALPSSDKPPSAFIHFALRYFHIVASSTNLVISPISLGTSLALLMDASKGETRRQITNLLGANADDIGAFYSNLIESLTKASERVIVQVATAIFMNKEIIISPAYSDHVKKAYAAITKNLDFSDGKESAKTVNGFIESATRKMISSSISAEEFKQDCGAIMINAMYFDAEWVNPFHLEITQTGIFYGLMGERKESLMLGSRKERCAVFSDVKILALAYTDPAYSLLLMMPSGDFVQWRQNLTAGYIEAAIDNLPSETKNAEVCLPKFRIETKVSLTEALEKMGVKNGFDRQKADFSCLAPDTPMFVEKIVQTSIFTVDEEGTRAATMTKQLCVAQCTHENMEFCDPFIYCLMRDRSVLFIGQFV